MDEIQRGIGGPVGYGKHFESMYQGSMVGAGATVFAVMGYIIAKQVPGAPPDNEKLFVELNPRLLAFIIGEPEEKIVEAIEFLCKADAGSRSKEEEGRRLVRVGQFAYWVVNGRKYRGMKDPERRREQWRESKRKARKSKGGKTASERAFEQAHANGDVRGMELASGTSGPDPWEGVPSGGEPEIGQ
jgi:hypothetical protein